MAAPSQSQLLRAGRVAPAGRPLLCLLALARAGVVAGGMLRLPQQSPSEAAQLLAMRQASQGHKPNATHFGPEGCIGLSKSNLGTCVIAVACGERNISQVDVAFVCLNRAAQPKRTQHSYGTGGFDAEEVFDSGVQCDSCSTVEFAQFTDGALVHNEVLTSGEEGAAAPSPAPSPGGEQHTGVDEALLHNGSKANGSDRTAFFGPSACISTYLSPAGTCMIQTRCRGVDLSSFAVGVTCLDKTGDYTRYLFGKNGFDDEELFDTTLKCQACIGVGLGDQPSYQLTGLVPKTIVEDLGTLKTEISDLRKEVSLLKQLHNDTSEQEHNASKEGDDASKEAAKAADGAEKSVAGAGGNSTSAPSPAPAAAAKKQGKADSAPAPSPAPAASGKKQGKAGQQLLAASTEPAGDTDADQPQSLRDLLRLASRREVES